MRGAEDQAALAAGKALKEKKPKRRSEELALTERRVFLAVAVALTAVSVTGPFFGIHGPFPVTSG